MKTKSILFTLLSIIGLSQIASAMFSISSTFDFDDEGWVVSGDATSATPDYNATGGNPGGFLSADDNVAGGVWYWDAPVKFLGNQSFSFGETLSFDLAQSVVANQFNASDVIIDSTSGSLHFDTNTNPGTSFTSYSIVLSDSADWRLTSLGGAVATNVQIQAVLANITRLRIRGEFRTGADTGSLDNVILTSSVPEPSTYALGMGILFMAFAAYSRRKRC